MKEQKTKIIKVDEETHKRLKTKAALNGISIKDLIKKLSFVEEMEKW